VRDLAAINAVLQHEIKGLCVPKTSFGLSS
jgi:hypothetical protein